MFPRIAIVDSVEMMRDGGSLAAIFHASDSCEYWLFFEILMRDLDGRTVERMGYAAPKIVNRHTHLDVLISWAQASTLLRQIDTMLCRNRGRDLNWLRTMQGVAASNGALPADMTKVMQSVRPADKT